MARLRHGSCQHQSTLAISVGYGYGTTFTGISDDRTKEAIKNYQNAREIAPSGVIDAETFWSLTRDNDWVDERVISMIRFDLYWYDDSVTANGVWDRMNDKATYLESTDIECDRAKGKCIEADAMISFNILAAKQTEFAITKWDEYEVVAEDTTPPCERDELRINHQEKSVTVISTPTYKNESCAKALGKPETITYRLVSGAQIASERSAVLQNHRKSLYLISPTARAIMDKKD